MFAFSGIGDFEKCVCLIKQFSLLYGIIEPRIRDLASIQTLRGEILKMSLRTIRSMLAWMDANLDGEPTLAGLSAYIGYSPVYCSAKLREFTGTSFRECLSTRRLSRAADELCSTGCRILEIALHYGFSSHEAFTRAFVKKYGCSPSQYRLRKGNANSVPEDIHDFHPEHVQRIDLLDYTDE